MAYCRFSNGDVYMFDSLSDMKIVCFACRLTPKDQYGVHGVVLFNTRKEALNHLEEHIDAGHEVGAGAIRRLREEISYGF